MKKTVLSLTLAASVLALGACNDESADSSKVIASSKVGDITQNDLYEEMKASIGDQAFQLLMIEKVLDSKYDVTDKQVDAQLKADKEQLGENFETLLAQQGYTEESYKKYLRLNLLQEAALIEDVEVSEDEIKAEYENTKNEINARHVLVEDEETAKKVKAELESGKDFAEVAKEYSTEPAAQQSGGELGWFGKGAMAKEFEDAAFALEPNVISDPVQSSFGFHIIEVTDKREAKESYEDKKAELEKSLKLEKADQSALLPKISKLLKDAKIDIKDKDLEKALDEFLAAGEASDSKEQPTTEEPEEETTEDTTENTEK